MSNGRRPARPDHHEVSDHVWKMIEGCWKNDPAKRKTMTEVVTILEAELNTISPNDELPHPPFICHSTPLVYVLYITALEGVNLARIS